MGKTASLANIGTIADSSLGFRNRLINSDMRIDQRNAGASVTPTVDGLYSLDRWQYSIAQASKFSIQQNAGSVTPPVGYINYLGVTSLSSYSVVSSDLFVIQQNIEGLNCADLAWGTANAATVTLSFWVRSSLTGTFGGSLRNNDSTRSYPFSFTVSSANTWEQKTVTVAGDTTGTWLTTNGTGIRVTFSLGMGSTKSGTAGAWAAGSYWSPTGATSVVGTNGATFYITGVQLEKGSTATSFDYRPYGTELALCQRYYYKETANAGSPLGQNAFAISATSARIMGKFAVTLRTRPTALEQTGTAANYFVYTGGTTRVCSAVPLFNDATTETWFVSATVASGQTAGHGGSAGSDAANVYLAWSAEL